MSKGCKDEVIKIGGHKVKMSSLDTGLLDKINKALGTTGCLAVGCCSGSKERSKIVKGSNRVKKVNRIDRVKGGAIGVRNIKKYGIGRKGLMKEWKSKDD